MDQAPDKLHDHHRQQLSAMLDGALFPDAARFMLRRLEHDAELAACWERWQVCGDAMRGNSPALLPADFAQRVARAVAAERGVAAMPAASADVPSTRVPRWARWGGGAAIAASVAMGALFVARQPADQGDAAQVAAVAGNTLPLPSDPARQAPVSPIAPIAPDAGGLAAALAVAEVPRRVAQRRPGAQSRSNAGVTRNAAQRQVAAASPPVLPGTAADPFAGLAQAPAGRPWPRAILPSHPASGGFNVDFAPQSMRPTFDVGSPAPPVPQFRDAGAQPASIPMRP